MALRGGNGHTPMDTRTLGESRPCVFRVLFANRLEDMPERFHSYGGQVDEVMLHGKYELCGAFEGLHLFKLLNGENMRHILTCRPGSCDCSFELNACNEMHYMPLFNEMGGGGE